MLLSIQQVGLEALFILCLFICVCLYACVTACLLRSACHRLDISVSTSELESIFVCSIDNSERNKGRKNDQQLFYQL